MPFTVIKARFESGLFDYRGVSQALLQISRDEGIKVSNRKNDTTTTCAKKLHIEYLLNEIIIVIKMHHQKRNSATSNVVEWDEGRGWLGVVSGLAKDGLGHPCPLIY